MEELGVGLGSRSIVMLVGGVRGMRVGGLDGALMGVEAPQLAGARCARRKEVDGAWLVMESHDMYERSICESTSRDSRCWSESKVLEVERGRRMAAAKPAAEPHGDKQTHPAIES